MSIDLSWLAYAMFYSFVALLFNILAQVVLTFLTPKRMLQAYFREPYFNAFELNFFTGLNAYFRTSIILKLAAWSNTDRKRGIPEDLHKLCPAWLQIISRWYMCFALVTGSLFFVSVIAFYVLNKLYGV